LNLFKLKAMKRIILCICVLCSLALSVTAQTNGKNGIKKQQSTTKKGVPNKGTNKLNKSNLANTSRQNTTVLSSTGTYNALGNLNTDSGRLIISDPTIRTFNQRAFTPMNSDVPGSGVIGMPKLAYGIANGQIIFCTSVAPTVGTSTGSGAVGTGTNVGAVGAGGNVMGVNGKNAYAGPGIYGQPLINVTGPKPTVEGTRPKGVRLKD
jgi:hypothetical protein